MMRFFGVFVALLVALAFVGCVSDPGTTTTTTTTTTVTTTSTSTAPAERKVNNSIPQFIKDALKKTPEDVLIGIGTARLGTLSLSRTTAGTRARAEISRQMETMIKDMVRDYTASSEMDPSATISFTENMTVALSNSKLTGSTIVEEDTDENGNYWVVVMLSKADTVAEINQAQAAAKLAVPAMASFVAEDRMNSYFDKNNQEEIGYRDN